MSAPSIGVIFHPRFPPETLSEYARKAEAAGFDELWFWDDCFLPGAFTSSAIALAATQRIKAGIGLLPVSAYNPLFAAMEITTLARAFPGRLLPGFGHGVGTWMTQIGAAPKSSLRALEETVQSIRRLLGGEEVTIQGTQVHLDRVQMQMTASVIPPLYIGAMRQKSLQVAGLIGDGTILTGMSSPAYVRWARQHIETGLDEAGRHQHPVVVYLDVKVNPDGKHARDAARQSLASRWPWANIHLQALGIEKEVTDFVEKYGVNGLAQSMPDEWLDAFAASGTPEQAAESIQHWIMAGADIVVLQPLDGDTDCLDEYIRYLMPLLKPDNAL